ncbi:4-alpha-glucanotransferase [Streptomyces sp. NPDC093249]|uniref:4-alpha-glucanotransferase n=1 Tax=unclassified Streptomyces TaxID=2593676 RepID=UPI0038192B03
MSDPLTALAEAYGVATAYRTDRGRDVEVSRDTLVAVLAACGVDGSTSGAARAALAARRAAGAARLVPPCVVVDGPGGPLPRLPRGARAEVRCADGRVRGAGDGPLPVGRHTLTVEADGRRDTAVLLVAPDRLAPAPYSWGFLVQLYFLLSRRSWGMGDLGDLKGLVSWAGRELGADFVQLGPLHAMEPGPLPDPSPYRPSSRRFPDPMHVRVEDVPEFTGLTAGPRDRVRQLTGRAAALNSAVLEGSSLIRREEVRELKLRALREVYEVPRTPEREAAFAAFTVREGDDLTDFATWCALAEAHGPAWRSWPVGLRDPRSAGVAGARRALASSVGFHRWLAWVTDEQLADAQRAARAAGMRIGLVHDLAVGVAPEGADAWSLRRCLAEGMSVGAPPDDFNPSGQDWGQPPWRPDALAAEGYRPFAALLRAGLRHAGALRVDHVMGLFRLWWVPEGRPPGEGTYVRYDGAAMLAVLAAEAADAGALVIGEDLGTVGAGVREALADRGVIGTAVQRFEYEGGSEGRLGPLPPEKWREHCLATLTTHDLPSTAAWLSGEHVELRHRLGLSARPVERERAEAARERDGWLAELARLGLLPDPAGEVAALHTYLGRTPARMIGVWLPDLTGDRRPQNLPGTAGLHPNWCLPVADGEGRPVALEELTGAPLAHHLAEAFAGRPEAHRDIEERYAQPGSC